MSAGSGEPPRSQRFPRHGATSDPLDLDPGTAERLLAGTLAGDDAPPAYRGVTQALETLRAAPCASELAGERAAVASIAANLTTHIPPAPEPAPPRHARAPRRLAIATASLVASATLLSGLAAANALPRPAQHIASEALHSLGVNVPDPDHQPDPRPDVRSPANDHTPPTRPAAPPNNIPPAPATDQPDALPSTNSSDTQTAPASIPTATNPNPPANGHSPTGPGNSNNANGHAPTGPGNSNNANGHAPTGPGNSNNAKSSNK
jgi:hypothetical protein